MRIPLHSGLGDTVPYYGPQPVVLFDGTVISDPGATSPTPGQCTPFDCNADNGQNKAARYWCSFYGQLSAKGCVDASCAPYRASIPAGSCPCNLLASGCPGPPNTAAPPGAPPPPPIPAPLPAPIPDVTTPTVAAPLPSLTVATQPDVLPEVIPDCSLWCSLNQAIAANPYIAVGAVALGVILLWPRKGTRR